MVIQALGRLRKRNCKFEASLVKQDFASKTDKQMNKPTPKQTKIEISDLFKKFYIGSLCIKETSLLPVIAIAN